MTTSATGANPSLTPLIAPTPRTATNDAERTDAGPRLRVRSWWSRWGWSASGAAALGVALVLIASSMGRSNLAPSVDDDMITARVTRATLPIIVAAGGELESAQAVDVLCEVEGQQIKVVEMLPEGSHVAAGDVVMRLDPSEVHDRLAQQQIKLAQAEALAKAAEEELKIQQNLAASQIAQAQLAVTLSELDREKYIEGDYQVEMNDLQGLIALAKTDLEKAKDTLEHYRTLVKKGFRTPEQLRAREQDVMRAQYTLNRDQQKLDVLQNYTRKRQEAELTAKAAETQRELERVQSSRAAVVAKAETDRDVAQATAQLEREQLARIKRQLERCEVRAPKQGTVVYAHDKKNPVELGGPVHYKQKLFSIPDLSRMQVRAWVHESVVKKVQPGMPVEIRVDAYPQYRLAGEVTEVANFYDSTRHWLSGGVKEYSTAMTIDTLPNVGFKPGMTAHVKILISKISDSLVVPLQAATEQEGRHVCYVVAGAEVERRTVVLGASTDNYVEIVEGLKEGEQVALDARRRAAADVRSGGNAAPDSMAAASRPSSAVAAGARAAP